MCIVQIAPNMRSCSPVHHTTKVARHVLHMPHTTRTQMHTQTQHTPSHYSHHTITPSDSAPSHTTTTPSPQAPPRQLHISNTPSLSPRPQKHINKRSLSKTDLSQSPQPSGDKVIWTLPKEVRGCDGAYDQHSEDDKCKLHDFLRDRDYDMIQVRTESFLVS